MNRDLWDEAADLDRIEVLRECDRLIEEWAASARLKVLLEGGSPLLDLLTATGPIQAIEDPS